MELKGFFYGIIEELDVFILDEDGLFLSRNDARSAAKDEYGDDPYPGDEFIIFDENKKVLETWKWAKTGGWVQKKAKVQKIESREFAMEIAEYMGVSAGIDTMPLSDLMDMLKERWSETCAELKAAEAIAYNTEIWWVAVDGKHSIDVEHFTSEYDALEYARNWFVDIPSDVIMGFGELWQYETEEGVWSIEWGRFNLTSLVNKEYTG